MMGLGQHFRKMDSSRDGVLDRNELQKALEAYHIRIPDEVSKIFLFVSSGIFFIYFIFIFLSLSYKNIHRKLPLLAYSSASRGKQRTLKRKVIQ